MLHYGVNPYFETVLVAMLVLAKQVLVVGGDFDRHKNVILMVVNGDKMRTKGE
jgi:hypothetical protein